jgi:acyl-CoA synthetase (AMP-forming)/AMP-acid ligase II
MNSICFSSVARAASDIVSRLVVPAMLASSAHRAPDKTALVFGGTKRSYAELWARSASVAAALGQRGTNPGDPIALLLHNGVEIVEAFFGCHLAGAVPVPVNYRLSKGEVAFILGDAGAVGIILDRDLADVGTSAAEDGGVVRWRLEVGGAVHGAHSYEDAVNACSPAPPDVAVAEDDIAFLIYTSGTTGRPKGAMITHRNLYASTVGWVHEVGAHQDDVWLSGQPLFHIGGINGLLPFLYLGATVVLHPSSRFDARRTIALMIEHRVTRCVFVPTQWRDICERPEAADLVTAGLKTALWGASAAPRETLELMERTFAGVDIVSAFGQTEMAGTTTMLKGDDSLRKLGSVGKPVIGVDTRIVDEDGNDVASGQVGELVYRGPTAMAGYHGNAAATEEAFAGGWLHSGDLLREDHEGFLYVVDRKKDMIISGGENIYPAEVERVLMSHPSVADVAVIGVPHPRWVETPLAVVVTVGGSAIDEAELIAHCLGRLTGFKRPSAVVFASSLPRNAGGKVLKRELRQLHRRHFVSDS